MNLVLFVTLAIAFGGQILLVRSYSWQECTSFRNALDDINNQLADQSRFHKYELYKNAGSSYVDRTSYILRRLNGDINIARSQAQASQYQSYNNQYGGIADDSCKQLENEILAKSKELGIEKIGLENNLSRLRKVLQHQDDKSKLYFQLHKECQTSIQECEVGQSELDEKIQELNAIQVQLNKSIKHMNSTITKLETEKKKLQARLNANAPAIHGETGIEYPVTGRNSTWPSITNERNETTSDSTSIVSTTTVQDTDESSSVPDIDSRNGATTDKEDTQQ